LLKDRRKAIAFGLNTGVDMSWFFLRSIFQWSATRDAPAGPLLRLAHVQNDKVALAHLPALLSTSALRGSLLVCLFGLFRRGSTAHAPRSQVDTPSFGRMYNCSASQSATKPINTNASILHLPRHRNRARFIVFPLLMLTPSVASCLRLAAPLDHRRMCARVALNLPP
jgi:hypothetical protein